MNKNFLRRQFSKLVQVNKNNNLQPRQKDSINEFCYNIAGIEQTDKKKFGFIYDQMLGFSQISEQWILDHIQKIYFGSLYSMAQKDEEFLNEYLETNFKNRLMKQLDFLDQENVKIKVEDDVLGKYGEPIENKIQILDSVFVKGLTTDRQQNGNPIDYHIHNDIEDMLTKPETFQAKRIDLENIYDDQRTAILRLLVKIVSPKILRFYDQDDKLIKVPTKYQTWTHIALFESDLKTPQKFNKKIDSETYQEWLGKFKFGKWILSDLDFDMKGNPLFKSAQGNKIYKDDVFKGTKLDPNISQDIRNVNQFQFFQMINFNKQMSNTVQINSGIMKYDQESKRVISDSRQGYIKFELVSQKE